MIGVEALKQMQDTWEAVASKDELRARYIGDGITRRYRVEGTPYGNSRLLRKKDAIDTAERYGGQVVEIITPLDLMKEQAKTLPMCPTCGVKAGEVCVTAKRKKPTSPHLSRFGTK